MHVWVGDKSKVFQSGSFQEIVWVTSSEVV